MVVIRLSRVGKKNSPAYRVVVADKQRAVKRKFIEVIGHYNPTLKPKEIVINKERAVFWLEKGAQASATVNNLMVDLSILKKDQKIKKIYAKSSKKKSQEEEKPATIENNTAETKADQPAEAENESKAEKEDVVKTEKEDTTPENKE